MGFRWDRLPKLSCAVAQATRVSGASARWARAIAAAVGQAVGAEVIVEPGPIAAVDPARLPDARVVVRTREGVAVVIDGALAARLAALAMGDRRPELPAPRKATPVEKDVLAYLATKAGALVERVGEEVGLDGALVGLDVHCRVISPLGAVSGIITAMWRADASPAAWPRHAPGGCGGGWVFIMRV